MYLINEVHWPWGLNWNCKVDLWKSIGTKTNTLSPLSVQRLQPLLVTFSFFLSSSSLMLSPMASLYLSICQSICQQCPLELPFSPTPSFMFPGAKPEEVCLMNGLTVNLHLLMVALVVRCFLLVLLCKFENVSWFFWNSVPPVRPLPAPDIPSSLSTDPRRPDTGSCWRIRPSLPTTWGQVANRGAELWPMLKQPALLQISNLNINRSITSENNISWWLIKVFFFFFFSLFKFFSSHFLFSTPLSPRFDSEALTPATACCCWPPVRYCGCTPLLTPGSTDHRIKEQILQKHAKTNK